MDSEQSSSVCAPKRERKANFSDEEVKVLLELYQQHFHILNSKFSSAVTQKKKTAVWADIATAVSSSGHAVRTMMDVRKKWVDLKRAALKANSEATRPQTGGGPKPERPWFTALILDILGQDSCLVSGIAGKVLRVL